MPLATPPLAMLIPLLGMLPPPHPLDGVSPTVSYVPSDPPPPPSGSKYPKMRLNTPFAIMQLPPAYPRTLSELKAIVPTLCEHHEGVNCDSAKTVRQRGGVLTK